jgi:hypothetical protein
MNIYQKNCYRKLLATKNWYAQSTRIFSKIEILAKIERKEKKIVLLVMPKGLQDLILAEKISKISQACVPLNVIDLQMGNYLVCISTVECIAY